MNKKGLEIETLVILILAVLVAAGMIAFSSIYLSTTKGTAAKTAVQTWVRTQGLVQGELGKGTLTQIKEQISGEGMPRPPVPELDKPYVIKKESDLKASGDSPPKAFEEIANSMYDCWDAFDRGQVDFLNRFHKNTFCYPCRIIKFSDDVRNEFPQIRGFNHYLNDYQPSPGANKPTYLQFLANDKDYKLDKDDLTNDIIDTKKDLYVIFFAASGRTWGNLALTFFGLEDFAESDITDYIATTSKQGEETVEFTGTGEEIGGARNIAFGSALGGGHLAAKGYLLKRKYLPGKYTAEKTTEELTQLLAKDAQLQSSLALKAEIEVTEEGAKKLALTFSDDAEKKGIKALSKTLGKKLALSGVRAMASKLTLYAAIAEMGYGTYKVLWGEKPFVATVMLAEPDAILARCNEE